jgi:hypothetical protein
VLSLSERRLPYRPLGYLCYADDLRVHSGGMARRGGVQGPRRHSLATLPEAFAVATEAPAPRTRRSSLTVRQAIPLLYDGILLISTESNVRACQSNKGPYQLYGPFVP